MNKKLLLAITALSFCFLANAQVTINQSDFVTPGKYLENANDTFPDASITLVGTGSQTWDFSLLQNHGLSTVTYSDPSTTPYYSAFPASTICGEQSTTYAYYVSNSSDITALGGHADFMFGTTNVSITLKNSPAETIIQFPATYNSGFTSDYTSSGKTAVVVFGSDSAKFKTVVNKTVMYDAYGPMTTPLGTYNTIRAKEVVISTDTIWLGFDFFGTHTWQEVNTSKDTTTTYKWYSNGLGSELVSANFNDSTQKIDYVTWMYSLSAGVSDLSGNSSFVTYPSPANEVFYVQSADLNARFVSLTDINGKQLMSQPIEGKITTVNTAILAPGFYLYSVKNAQNAVIGSGKIAVTH